MMIYQVKIPTRIYFCKHWGDVANLLYVYPFASFKKVNGTLEKEIEVKKNKPTLNQLLYFTDIDTRFKLSKSYVHIQIFDRITTFKFNNIDTEIDITNYDNYAKKDNYIIAESNNIKHESLQHRMIIQTTLALSLVGDYFDVLLEFEHMSMMYACLYNGKDIIISRLSKLIKDRIGMTEFKITRRQYVGKVRYEDE